MNNFKDKIKLFGLNDKQADTYIYILTHKTVTLKSYLIFWMYQYREYQTSQKS